MRLNAHKTALLRRISEGRVECAHAMTCVARRLEWLDRAVAFWRRLAPYANVAAVPAALLAKRLLFPRARLVGTLLRWGPAAYNLIRGFRSLRR